MIYQQPKTMAIEMIPIFIHSHSRCFAATLSSCFDATLPYLCACVPRRDKECLVPREMRQTADVSIFRPWNYSLCMHRYYIILSVVYSTVSPHILPNEIQYGPLWIHRVYDSVIKSWQTKTTNVSTWHIQICVRLKYGQLCMSERKNLNKNEDVNGLACSARKKWESERARERACNIFSLIWIGNDEISLKYKACNAGSMW